MQKKLSMLVFCIIFYTAINAQEKEMSSYSLPNVTLTGVRITERVSFKNTYIDSLVIRENISSNLGELLALKTPIFIKNYGVGGASTPSFRGTGASHTQIYWNGVNLNSPMLGQVDLSLFPVAISDEIEVNFGGSSLAYGTGGLGGALQMNSAPKWGDNLLVNASQTFASYGNYITNFSITTGNIFIQNTVKAYYKSGKNDFEFINVYQKDYPTWKNVHAEQTQYGFVDEFDWRINENNSTGAKIWVQSADRNLPPSMDKNISYANQKDASFRSVIFHKYNKEKLHSDINLSYIKDYLYYYDDRTKIESESKVDIVQSRGNLTYDYSGKLHLKTGYSLNYNKANADNYRDLNSGEKVLRTQNTIDILAGLEWIPINNMSVSALIRQQWIDGDRKPFLPSLGVDYKLYNNSRNSFSLKSNLTRNFHAPSLNDKYWFPVGNPNLLPEDGWQGEFGSTWEQKNNSSSPWTNLISVTAFAAIINNWIIWKPGVSNLWRPENMKKVFSRGIEIVAKSNYVIGDVKLEGYGSFSFTKSENQEPYNNLDNSVGQQLIYTPVENIQGYLSARYQGWNIMFEQQIAGERNVQTDGSEYLPAYFISNFVIGKDIRVNNKQKLNIRFKTNNIFNYYYQSIARKPMMGRNYMLTISYSLI